MSGEAAEKAAFLLGNESKLLRRQNHELKAALKQQGGRGGSRRDVYEETVMFMDRFLAVGELVEEGEALHERMRECEEREERRERELAQARHGVKQVVSDDGCIKSCS